MLVGRPVNTDRTKREIFEPHGYFRTLELVRPSFAHNPEKETSALIARNQTGSGLQATGRRFVDSIRSYLITRGLPTRRACRLSDPNFGRGRRGTSYKFKRMFEKSCQCQLHRTGYRLYTRRACSLA